MFGGQQCLVHISSDRRSRELLERKSYLRNFWYCAGECGDYNLTYNSEGGRGRAGGGGRHIEGSVHDGGGVGARIRVLLERKTYLRNFWYCVSQCGMQAWHF